jgi:hypothetical protein
VPAKVIKLVGLTRPPFLSTNLITFAGTQNGEYQRLDLIFYVKYYRLTIFCIKKNSASPTTKNTGSNFFLRIRTPDEKRFISILKLL